MALPQSIPKNTFTDATSAEDQNKTVSLAPRDDEGHFRWLVENPLRVFLVDDDPLFAEIMKHSAFELKVEILATTNISNIGPLVNWDFDVAIVDYDLGSITGVDLSTYISYFIGDFPIVLISHSDREHQLENMCHNHDKAFIHKSLGPLKIIETALNVQKEWLSRKTLQLSPTFRPKRSA